MSTSRDPADSLQSKMAAFIETLEPGELDLFAVIMERAHGADVEGFATPSAPGPIPIPYPLNPVAATSVAQVLNGVGSTLSATALKRGSPRAR